MSMISKPWYRRKTNITAIIAMVTAIGAFATGEIQLGALAEVIFGAVTVIFMRQGIEKSGRGE